MADSTSLTNFIHSSVIFTFAGVLVNILGYAFHILVGRFLGASYYSEITTVFAYGMILSVPILVVNVIVVSQSGSQTAGDSRAAFLNSLRVYFDNLTRSIPILIGIYLVMVILGLFNRLSLPTAIVMPAFVLTLLYAQLYPILLQSAKKFIPLSLILLAAAVMKLGSAAVAPFYPSPALILSLLVLANLTTIWLSRCVLPRSLVHTVPFTLAQLFRDPRFKLAFLSLLGLIAFNNMDVILAKQFLSAEQSGMYGAWSLFAKAITYSFLPLSSVALVFFTDHDTRHQSSSIMLLSLLFLGAIGLVAYFAFKILAPFLVTALMGPTFTPLLPLLPLAAIFGTAYSMIYFLTNYYLARSSKLALVPAAIAIVAPLTLLIFGRDLAVFTRLMTLLAGFSLLLYPTTLLLRTRLSFSRPLQ